MRRGSGAASSRAERAFAIIAAATLLLPTGVRAQTELVARVDTRAERTHALAQGMRGGVDIGNKGMMAAEKTLALTAAALLRDPATLERARAEFTERRGDAFVHRPLVGDREPPLDYRK